MIKAPQTAKPSGPKFWIEGITRPLLESVVLRRRIDAGSVTGLAFNPAALALAIRKSAAYDDAIREKLKDDLIGEALLLELAVADLRAAADLMRPLHDRSGGLDGWVSMAVSPLLAEDSAVAVAAARDLYSWAARPNLFIEIPGTGAGLPAVEEAIFAGIPVNVTLLFSREHYLAAANAFLSGIERRIANGLNPDVGSVVSLHLSPWDAAAAERAAGDMKGGLGMAVAGHVHHAWRELLQSPRWMRIRDAGARPQRLVWAVVSPVDPEGFCAGLFAFSDTVVSMSEGTLLAFADHDEPVARIPEPGGDGEAALAAIGEAGVDVDSLAGRLRRDAMASLVKSWIDAMTAIASKSAVLTPAI